MNRLKAFRNSVMTGLVAFNAFSLYLQSNSLQPNSLSLVIICVICGYNGFLADDYFSLDFTYNRLPDFANYPFSSFEVSLRSKN